MMFYDRKGNEIDLKRFGELYEDISYRKVREDHIDGTIISTVWIGVDPYFYKKDINDKNIPKIFQTRKLSPCEGTELIHMMYYSSSTEAQSIKIHEYLIQEQKPNENKKKGNKK